MMSFFLSLPGLVIVALCAAFFGYALLPLIINKVNKFNKKPPIIKKYWIFVIPFAFTLVLTYWLLISYFGTDPKIDLYVNILNQISTLIFAIFVGYFSFLQVIENRADKLKNEAGQYLSSRVRDYPRAIKTFEEILAIEPNNFYNLANLLETYLIQKDFKSFEGKMEHLKRCIFSEKDELVYQYVMILYYMLKGHGADVDRHIAELIEFKKKNPDVLINWNFNDFTGSKTYEANLPKDTDFRLKFDNLVNYYNKTMSPENTLRFEAGDYIMRSPTE